MLPPVYHLWVKVETPHYLLLPSVKQRSSEYHFYCCLVWLNPESGWLYSYYQGCRNPKGMGDIFPPIICVWYTSASPPIIWLWCASEPRSPLEFEKKRVPFLVKTFFSYFDLHLNLGEKVLHFWWRPFFLFGLHLICSPEKKSWSRFFPLNVENRAKLG